MIVDKIIHSMNMCIKKEKVVYENNKRTLILKNS